MSAWAVFYAYPVSPFVSMHEFSYTKTRGEIPSCCDSLNDEQREFIYTSFLLYLPKRGRVPRLWIPFSRGRFDRNAASTRRVHERTRLLGGFRQGGRCDSQRLELAPLSATGISWSAELQRCWIRIQCVPLLPATKSLPHVPLSTLLLPSGQAGRLSRHCQAVW